MSNKGQDQLAVPTMEVLLVPSPPSYLFPKFRLEQNTFEHVPPAT